MLNDLRSTFSMSVSVDWLSSRFIAFGLPAGQDKKGQGGALAPSRPVLLYSRSTALELLLSIALREASVRQSRFYHPFFVQDKNGLLFNNKVVPFYNTFAKIGEW